MAVSNPAFGSSTEATRAKDSIERTKMSTPLQLAWARFRRNKLGIVGAIIVFLFIFVGIAAPGELTSRKLPTVAIENGSPTTGLDTATCCGTGLPSPAFTVNDSAAGVTVKVGATPPTTRTR